MDLSHSEIEDLVAELRAIHDRSSWSRVLDAGKLVLRAFANNDERTWRRVSRRRASSLRRLAEHRGCPFKKTALSSAVNTHIFVRANPSVLEMPGITPTHVGLVVRFGHKQAMEMLSTASKNSWSVREVRRQVRALLRHSGERRGRPLSSSASKAETRARRALEALRSVRELLADSAPSDPGIRTALCRILGQISELVSRTTGQLEPSSFLPAERLPSKRTHEPFPASSLLIDADRLS